MKKFTGILTLLVMGFVAHSQQLVHYWDFNDNATIQAMLTPSFSEITVAEIIHNQGGISDVVVGTGQGFDLENLNSKNGAIAGSHLRLNDPIGASLVFKMPTTNYTNIVVSFATRRSGSGAGTQYWSYTTDGINFMLFDSIFPSDAGPALNILNFTGLADVADNENFALSVSFEQGQGGLVGNNRFDNFALEGDELVSLLHYWNFNDISSYASLVAPSFTVGGAQLDTLQFEGGNAEIIFDRGTNADLAQNLNARLGADAGTHLRFNNPVFGALVFSVPSVNKENIVVQYATVRSGSGAYLQFVEYSTDGINYVAYDTFEINTSTGQQVVMIDLRAVQAANNNPDLKIKIRFGQGGGGLAGNNRIDNFTVEAIAPDLSGKVTSITVDPKQSILSIQETTQLVATISPVDAVNKDVVWSSSDVAIAAVSVDGLVTAVAEGTCSVYAVSVDGGYTDSCVVTVLAAPTADLLYYWHFNDLNPPADVTQIDADFNILQNINAKLTYTEPANRKEGQRDIDRFSPGTALNIQPATIAGGSARVRNPAIGRSLVFDMPTNGLSDIVFAYAVQRSGSGMLLNTIEYSIDGTTFIATNLADNSQEVIGVEEWQVFSFDFSNIPAVNDNGNFKIRITWDGNNDTDNGNNRYDNITLMGNGSNATVTAVLPETIKLYPNPANGFLNVSSKDHVQSMVLIDMQGRVLAEGSGSKLDVNHCKPGVYVLLLTTNGTNYTQRVVLH